MSVQYQKLIALVCLLILTIGCASRATSLQPRTEAYRVGPPGSQSIGFLLDHHKTEKSQLENSKAAADRLLDTMRKKIEAHRLNNGANRLQAQETSRQTISHVQAMDEQPIEKQIDTSANLMMQLPPEFVTAIGWVRNAKTSQVASSMFLAANLEYLEDIDKNTFEDAADLIGKTADKRHQALIQQQKSDRELAEAVADARLNYTTTTLPAAPRSTPLLGTETVIELPKDLNGGRYKTMGRSYGPRAKISQNVVFTYFDGLTGSQIVNWVNNEVSRNQKGAQAARYAYNAMQQQLSQFAASGDKNIFARMNSIYLPQISEAQRAEGQFEDNVKRVRAAYTDYMKYWAGQNTKKDATINNKAYRSMLNSGALSPSSETMKSIDSARDKANSRGFVDGRSPRAYLEDPGTYAQWVDLGFDLPDQSTRSFYVSEQSIFPNTVPVSALISPNSFRELLNQSAAAVRMGEIKEAIAVANKAAALDPSRWEPYFLIMSAHVVDKDWDRASRFLLQALKRGYDASINPKYIEKIIYHLRGLSESDPEVVTFFMQLNRLYAADPAQDKTSQIHSSTRTLLSHSTKWAEYEKMLARELIAASRKATESSGAGARHYKVTAPSVLISAWIGKDGIVSAPSASLLRLISDGGGALLAVPDSSKGAVFTHDDIQRELTTWREGGRDSRWKLIWSTELAAELDPYGHHPVREAVGQLYERSKTSGREIYIADITHEIARLHCDWASTPSAPVQVQGDWSRDRRDGRRSVFTTELRAAPTSKTMWLAATSFYDAFGSSGRPFGQEIDKTEYCLTLAGSLSQRYGTDVSAAALLALAENEHVLINGSADPWYDEILESTIRK